MKRAMILAGAMALAVGFGQAYIPAQAQQAPPPAAPPPTAQSQAGFDLTGVWVSIVTEEWRWRMVTPPKGDFDTIPITDEARTVGNTWDPAKDTADGNACRAYGAIGIMRIPARFRFSWQDPNTLKMEVDAGQQTRLFRFGDLQAPAGSGDWQGFSAARWLRPGGLDPAAAQARGRGAFGAFVPAAPGRGGAGAPNAAPPVPRGGTLLIRTTNMKSGYLRKNGLPYSENATMTEYFNTHRTPDGNQWLTVTQLVRDPRFIQGEYVSNWHYRKEPDAAKWRPTPCTAA
ncbi:MAG: hypothetical protein ABL986_19930 [Vicinamibacterales bacterium]